MKIQQFITKAIMGGWLDGWESLGVVHGGKYPAYVFSNDEDRLNLSVSDILLDPLAWSAVGKVEGWGSARVLGKYGITERNTYVHYMHSFIDHLCDGLTLEEALDRATS